MKNIKEMQNKFLQLTKDSNSEQMTNYFKKIFELKQTGDYFPVTLDSIWPLAYPRKDHAVRVLKSDFIEGVDYQVLRNYGEQKQPDSQLLPKNGEQRGGHNKISYMLSVDCMEYFIAKKVKPVFEVYRKVFHKAIEGTVHFENKNFITKQEYCEMYCKSIHSFNALFGHYPMEFFYAGGVWSISTDLCKKVELENTVVSTRRKLKERNDPDQLQLKFNEGGQA